MTAVELFLALGVGFAVSMTAKDPKIETTKADIDLMARVVMSESSTESQECKEAIASVIINRVLSEDFPDTVEEVVNEPNQLSTRNNGEPTQKCYDAVYTALYFETIPEDVLFFRTGHYHEWAKDYDKIDHTYFSKKKQ